CFPARAVPSAVAGRDRPDNYSYRRPLQAPPSPPPPAASGSSPSRPVTVSPARLRGPTRLPFPLHCPPSRSPELVGEGLADVPVVPELRLAPRRERPRMPGRAPGAGAADHGLPVRRLLLASARRR